MKLVSSLIGLAFVAGLGLAGGACGDDNPAVQDSTVVDTIDSGSGSGSATLTTFVIDLITNHGNDPTPAAFDTFKDLPDPDGDNNVVHAYDSLF